MLEAGGAYVARGPGRLVVESGSIEILGYPVEAGGSVVVPVGRSVPFLVAEDGARVSFTGSLEPWSREEYLRMDSLASKIAHGERVLLVGPSDVGKSTLAAWAVNKMALNGGKPVFATLDVGQNENYCPGFASSSRVEPPFIPGSGAPVERACFVGSFTPRGVESRYVYCASMIVEGAGWWVVDTDGWVGDWEALDSKVAAARALRPDLVVVVGLDERLAGYLEPRLGVETMRVPRLVESRKTREERRIHRERLLARALQGGREITVRPGSTMIYGLPIFIGEQIPVEEASGLLGTRVYYAEKGPGGTVVVVPPRARVPQYQGGGLRILRDGWEKGLIAAVYVDGIPRPGLVTRISYRRLALHVYTSADGKPEMVEVGRSRVDPKSFMGSSR